MPDSFDRLIPRENTCSVKFDARKAVFGREDVIPLWVADMDFAAPEAVTQALEQRARHPVYGYTLFPESIYASIIDWFRFRHGWTIERDWLLMAPGVVPSLHAASMAFAGEGEGVIIQPPVYPPFFSSIQKTGRVVIENPLEQVDGSYRMNLEHLEACAARDDARVLMLCSPHNPVGRVWTESELEAVLAIARQHNLVVLSDEIHCDLIYPDKPAHHVLARLAGEDDALVTAVAPSKTFNMPGLGLSALVVPNRQHRKALKEVFDSMHMIQCNPFSIAGFEAGYRHGGQWLDQLMTYLQGNRDYVMDYVRQHLPLIRVTEPDGTYLLWLDCRAMGMDDSALKHFFVHRAGIGMNPGATFGEPGSGFMRINIGCPRQVLETALEQIRQAFATLPD
ncbi:pyridoxal phosphate-dependent aminotransferase [Marinobacter sp. TBZ242]|uniref:cysteine-S-conjugate beta-lyase n=1 Tax=Marinobacter azerbaijanicus TaxID=3050455 RepID=A0ABT7ICA7_9GAMM|nr:pyridoxal phosphate-dependent aminotransferase [Marinobacter sp. TBZ242]MDL0430818.1 pyridoxal phosphate-dependent aminotransferase [Marinobacter sp. TBZ242]